MRGRGLVAAATAAALAAAGARLPTARRVRDAVCPTADASKYDCYPWTSENGPGGVANNTVCAAHGCCWATSPNSGVPWCFYPSLPTPPAASCAAVTVASRLDCHPEPDASQVSCQARGCCWDTSQPGPTPACFYPHTDGYTSSPPTPTANGFTSTLSLGAAAGPFRNDVATLSLSVQYLTQTSVRFTITDPATERWVPPVPLQPQPGTAPAAMDYTVDITQAPDPFGITVTRTSSGQVLFDSRVPATAPVTNGLIFEDQYIELSTAMPVLPDGTVPVYGLAEHITPLKLPSNGTAGQVYTMLARDQGTPVHNPAGNTNLYASHPFYLSLDPATGEAYGVFLFNSNAMDVVLQPGALTYRVIGGVVDVYVFTGPTPADVVRQYQALVGTPRMPPRWGLGFHLCRWGYGNYTNMRGIWQSMLDNNLPQDSQWADIDYMRSHLDFTTDPVNFPTATMSAWATNDLPAHGQHLVLIFDPAIANTQPPGTYPPWDQGVAADVFIRDRYGNIFNGSVWPGPTAFPDFFAPGTAAWWQAQFAAFHAQVPVSGAWIDMNEPSSFSTNAADRAVTKSSVLRVDPADPGDPMYPPYLPGRTGGAQWLDDKTVSMSARHAIGSHYNVHNLYGWSEGVATVAAMEGIRGKRSLVISRSTFPTSGVYNGHWLGDNAATWDDLYYSLPGVLTFNLMGIPLVGSDTCGFGGSATTPELCTRWMAVSAFTAGFYRNHNTIGKAEQAPAVFPDPYRSYMRASLNNRLALLPYWYTLFHHAHVAGDTVTRPLLLEWPADSTTYAIDRQVMLGGALLVSPVLTQGATTVSAYFPAATWFDFFTGAPAGVAVPGWNTLPAPLSVIPVHLRGGFIVPVQQPNMTTTFTSSNPLWLAVALDGTTGAAAGDLFLDDGETLRTYESGAYSWVSWSVASAAGGSAGNLTTTVMSAAYSPPATVLIAYLRVSGVSSAPATASVNGKPITPQWNSTASTLTLPLPGGGLSPIVGMNVTWA